MTTDKIQSEPCDECAVDTLALLNERDQLKARVAELEDLLLIREDFATTLQKQYVKDRTRYESALKDAKAALEFSGRVLKQVYVGPEAPKPYLAQDARESCMAALATINKALGEVKP